MSNAAILLTMTSLFLIFGYMGVPVAFSLTAGVVIGAAFTDVTFAAIVSTTPRSATLLPHSWLWSSLAINAHQ